MSESISSFHNIGAYEVIPASESWCNTQYSDVVVKRERMRAVPTFMNYVLDAGRILILLTVLAIIAVTTLLFFASIQRSRNYTFSRPPECLAPYVRARVSYKYEMPDSVIKISSFLRYSFAGDQRPLYFHYECVPKVEAVRLEFLRRRGKLAIKQCQYFSELTILEREALMHTLEAKFPRFDGDKLRPRFPPSYALLFVTVIPVLWRFLIDKRRAHAEAVYKALLRDLGENQHLRMATGVDVVITQEQVFRENRFLERAYFMRLVDDGDEICVHDSAFCLVEK